MGLLDDLKDDASFPKPARAKCSVCEFIKELDKTEREMLLARFDDTNITHMAISAVLKKNGITLSDSVIGRHRRKVCAGWR